MPSSFLWHCPHLRNMAELREWDQARRATDTARRWNWRRSGCGRGRAIYFVTHRSSKVTGCVVKGDGGLFLTDDKSKRTFELVEGSADVTSGERVELKGKIRKSESGNPRFQVKSIAKELGECRAQASASAEIPAVAQPK